MGNARRDFAQCRQPFADLQLRIDAFERVEVTQSDKRTHLFSIFLNRLYADADAAPAVCRLQLGFRSCFTKLIAVQMQRLAQRMTGRENFCDAAPEKLRRW